MYVYIRAYPCMSRGITRFRFLFNRVSTERKGFLFCYFVVLLVHLLFAGLYWSFSKHSLTEGISRCSSCCRSFGEARIEVSLLVMDLRLVKVLTKKMFQQELLRNHVCEMAKTSRLCTNTNAWGTNYRLELVFCTSLLIAKEICTSVRTISESYARTTNKRCMHSVILQTMIE